MMLHAHHILAVLMHMEEGAPPGGSRLLTIRFQNNAQGNSERRSMINRLYEKALCSLHIM